MALHSSIFHLCVEIVSRSNACNCCQPEYRVVCECQDRMLTDLDDFRFCHAACNIALVLEDQKTGAHESLQMISVSFLGWLYVCNGPLAAEALSAHADSLRYALDPSRQQPRSACQSFQNNSSNTFAVSSVRRRPLEDE